MYNKKASFYYLLFFSLTILVGCAKSAKVGDTFTPYWEKITDFPVKREGAVAFSVGGKMYVGLGLGENQVNDFYVYDSSSKAWNKIADFPGGIRRNPSCFVIDDIAYVGAGFDGAFASKNDFYSYDYKSNTWTKIADFPGHVRTMASSFTVGGKGYVGLGIYSPLVSGFSDFYAYDKSQNTWTKVADFPGKGRYFATSFVLDSIAYVGLGGDIASQKVYSDFYSYDYKSNTWSPIKDFVDGARVGGLGSSMGNTTKAVVATGMNPSGIYLSNFFTYNGDTHTWGDTAITDYPTGGVLDASICDLGNGNLYIGLGSMLIDTAQKQSTWEKDYFTPNKGNVAPSRVPSKTFYVYHYSSK